MQCKINVSYSKKNNNDLATSAPVYEETWFNNRHGGGWLLIHVQDIVRKVKIDSLRSIHPLLRAYSIHNTHRML